MHFSSTKLEFLNIYNFRNYDLNIFTQSYDRNETDLTTTISFLLNFRKSIFVDLFKLYHLQGDYFSLLLFTQHKSDVSLSHCFTLPMRVYEWLFIYTLPIT